MLPINEELMLHSVFSSGNFDKSSSGVNFAITAPVS